MKSVAVVAIATLFLCSHAYADHHKSTSKEEMVKRIVKYFPGKWEYKSDDGDTQGSADWSALAGGTSIGGPAKTESGSGFALAGWDPEKKIWLHIWHQDDGQFGRLEVQRFQGDTYYGKLRVVEGDGSASDFEWENKIVDKDHFVITQRSGDDVTKIHWRRKKKLTKAEFSEFCKLATGRWVGQITLDADYPGQSKKKGEKQVVYYDFAPILDGQGLELVAYMGNIKGRVMYGWDATSDIARAFIVNSAGAVQHASLWKSLDRVFPFKIGPGGQPDGRKVVGTGEHRFSQDGKTLTVTANTKMGDEEVSTRNVFRRVSED